MVFGTIREAINEPAVQVAPVPPRQSQKGKRRYIDVLDAPALEMDLFLGATD
jgi:hypothetical protein